MAWAYCRDRGKPARVSIWPRRRPALPAYARAWLDLGERVLTFASTPYGDLVLATPKGIWIADHASAPAAAGSADSSGSAPGRRLLTSADGPGGHRLPWESIVSAKWAGEALTITTAVEVAPQIMKRQPPITLALPEPADLPRVVRQRVDRSVAASYRRPLAKAATVLLVARRVSGQDGLLWYAVFDRDSDADDRAARRQALDLLESASAAMAPRPYLD